MILFALLSALFVAISSDATCGDGQYYYAGTNKCFYFPIQYTAYFPNARSYCQQYGGDLAIIHNGQEDRFLTTLQNNSGISYAWIGLIINTTTNSTYWYDGTAMDYSNWWNTPGSYAVYAYKNDNYKFEWVPTSIYDMNIPMCQRSAGVQSITTPAPSGCPTGAVYSSSSNKCFQVQTTQQSWEAARSNCLKQGGDLASIHSIAENQLISNAAKSQGIGGFWVGFNRFINHSNNYTWSDGSNVDYQNWNSGVPGSCSNGPQDCVTVDSSRGDWYNCWPCTQTLSSVCELPFPSSGIRQEAPAVEKTQPKSSRKH